jgi:hypothetical protein
MQRPSSILVTLASLVRFVVRFFFLLTLTVRRAEAPSIERIHDRTLRHLIMYSPLIQNAQRHHLLAPENSLTTIRNTVNISMLSEFPLLLSGDIKLQVPVFTVAGACEDILLLEKLRTGTYDVENLHLIDEATTRCLDIGGIKLRLLGLGGAFVPHKMFDNGEGSATIAGGNGTIWTTALQIGELVDTSQRVYDPTETRLLITHASPGREGIIAALALVLKADLTISAGLHFRYASSWNEFSVQGDYEGFKSKLRNGRETFYRVWDSVKSQVDNVIDENQRVLLTKALSVVDRVPLSGNSAPGRGPSGTEESSWKNCWNWNLCDAAYGALILDVKEGRVSAELKSQGVFLDHQRRPLVHFSLLGFNYAYRRSATPTTQPTPTSTKPPLPPQTTTSITPIKAQTPVPAAEKATPQGPDAPSSPRVVPSTSEPISGKETPPVPKVNGSDSASASTPGSAEKDKGERDRESSQKYKSKRKERKDHDRDRAGKDATRDADAEGSGGERKDDAVATTALPKPDLDTTGSPAPGSDAGPQSPRTESTGTRTPTIRKQGRNHPWTLFVRLPNPANESELRQFFGEAKEGVRVFVQLQRLHLYQYVGLYIVQITRVHFPAPQNGRERKIAYVEFVDEEAMAAGLEKRGEVLFAFSVLAIP